MEQVEEEKSIVDFEIANIAPKFNPSEQGESMDSNLQSARLLKSEIEKFLIDEEQPHCDYTMFKKTPEL